MIMFRKVLYMRSILTIIVQLVNSRLLVVEIKWRFIFIILLSYGKYLLSLACYDDSSLMIVTMIINH